MSQTAPRRKHRIYRAICIHCNWSKSTHHPWPSPPLCHECVEPMVVVDGSARWTVDDLADYIRRGI